MKEKSPIVRDCHALTEIWSVTLLVFLRSNFGERFLTWGMIANGITLLVSVPVAVLLLGSIFVFARPVNETSFIGPALSFGLFVWGFSFHFIYTAAFLIVGSRHRWELNHRAVGHRYTRVVGELPFVWFSLLFLRIRKDPWDVERFAEPLFVFVAGILLLSVLNWFGFYLMVGSVSLFLTARRDWLDYREMLFDAEDGLLHARHMTSALKLEASKAAEEFVVILEERPRSREIPSVKEAYQKLPERLRALVKRSAKGREFFTEEKTALKALPDKRRENNAAITLWEKK